MFGTILGKYKHEESQEFRDENALEEDSRGFEFQGFRSNVPQMMRTDDVEFIQAEAELRLRQMTEYSHLKYVLLPDDTFKLVWDIVLLA